MKPKLVDVFAEDLSDYFFEDTIDNLLIKLEEIKDRLTKEGFQKIRIDRGYDYTEYSICAVRLETSKELSERKKQKEKEKIAKEALKQERFQQYQQLKKEFE